MSVIALATAGAVHARSAVHAQPAEKERLAIAGRLEAYVADGMRAAGDPGAVLVVADDRGIVRCSAFGVDTEGRRISCSTRFPIASLTKGFTAIAVLASAERGRLQVDAPVKDVLPRFRRDDEKPITVADLLLMRSGLSTEDGKRWLASRDDDAGAIDRRVRALDTARLVTRPGTAYAYSNANYDVLGAVLEAANHASYEDVMQAQVLRPLGIPDARFSREPRFKNDRPVRGFSRLLSVPVPGLPAPHDRGDDPAAGLVIDALGVGRYLSAHLDAGATWSAKVLSREGWQRLHASPVDSPYAMGWLDALLEDRVHHLYRHDGLAPDYHAFALFVPLRHIGVALLVNASEEPDGGRRDAFDRGITRIVLGLAPQRQALVPRDLPPRIALLVGLIAAVYAATRSIRASSTRNRLLAQAAILAVAGGALWLYVAPQMGGTLAAGFVYSPDLGAMLIALFAVIATTAVVSVVRAVRMPVRRGPLRR